MNYINKLTVRRSRVSSSMERDFNGEMESDRGRAINSAAVRRLQQKTQVFPLETNAAVRSRLTHSLEVQQTGRYISKLILKELRSKGKLEELGLSGSEEGFTSAVEIACLLHDVGNPPFGHFGEEAINIWSGKVLKDIFINKFGDDVVNSRLLKDLMTFEGNAQAIRLLHSLQKLNLTYTQTACLLKYTRAAYEDKPVKNDQFSYRKKKPGFYYSEEEFVRQMRDALDMGDGCRFPLTYIMEAADDISYCIADLDDALDKGILDVPQLHKAINDVWMASENNEHIDKTVAGRGYLTEIADKALARYEKEEHNKNHAYILTLRTNLVNDLAKYASKRFIENHDEIFAGFFDEPLLGGSDEYFLATETLKTVAVSKVFSAPEVERLELKGLRVISGLLEIYTPLLEMPFKSFAELAISDIKKSSPIETRLYHDLSNKHKQTYKESVKSLLEKGELSEEEEKLELYYRARLLIDYVSGMTDSFALQEYRELTASI